MLGNKIALGAAWSMGLNIVTRGLSLISIIILTRLITPHDLGVYAAAAVVVELIYVLTEVGIYPTLIQRKDVTPQLYQTAWSIQLVRAIIIFSIIHLFATFFVSIYSDQPEVRDALQILSLVVIVSGFTSIYLVNFQKNLDFKSLMKFDVTCRLIGFFTTIVAAYILRSFWALVIGNLVQESARVILSHIVVSGRHRITFKAAPDILRTSHWLFLSGLSGFISLKTDTFLITRFAGTKALGIYELGYQIAIVPSQQIALPVARALFPGLAKVQDDSKEFARIFTKTISAILYIAIPAGVALVLLAQIIVEALFTEEWYDAVVIIQILAIFGMVRIIFGPCTSALMGSGRMALHAKLTMLNASMRIAALSIGLLQFGVIGLCWAAVGVAVIQACIYLTILRRLRMVDIILVVKSIWRTVVASILMGGVLMLTVQYCYSFVEKSNLLILLIVIGVGSGSYLIAVAGLWVITGRPEGLEALLYNRVIRPKVSGR